MRYHNDTPRQCEICHKNKNKKNQNKMYPNKNALNSHMRTVHSDKKFPCTICEKAFRVRILLTVFI